MPNKKSRTKTSKSNARKLINLNKWKKWQKITAFAVTFGLVGSVIVFKSFAATPHCINSTFRQGSSGACVSDIQYMLNGANYYYHFAGNPPIMLKVDGKYGSSTALIVGAFQAAHKNILKVDGIVGSQTWPVLCSYGYADYSPHAPLVIVQAYLGTIAAGCKPMT